MTSSNDNSGRRKPKGDKRDRTRAALLEAARQLVREKGHERTTLEEVAARAGMTTGAIYGNFKNRDELFIALGHSYWPPVKPDVAAGATFAPPTAGCWLPMGLKFGSTCLPLALTRRMRWLELSEK